MAGKNFAFKMKSQEVGEEADSITLENASTKTIYQLRQELTKRGIFDEIFGHDGEKRNINFESCLQVMMAELVKDKDAADAAHTAELEAQLAPEGETLQEKLTREKEERKQAATERSRKRQEEKAYFEARKEANERGAVEKAAKAKAAASPPTPEATSSQGEDAPETGPEE